MSKYLNKKTVVHGITFDSKAEASRYLELVMLQNSGAITNLEMQVPFELIPKQDGERPVKYLADFVYCENGKKVVEDVKSPITRKKPDYIIKRKLLKFRHNVEIKETGKK
jgi:hypothetical protein